VPPSILYSTVNPLTEVTDGNVNDAKHSETGDVITGAAGNMAIVIALLLQGATVPAALEPHPDDKTYSACNV
jgi:hypothetical protein